MSTLSVDVQGSWITRYDVHSGQLVACAITLVLLDTGTGYSLVVVPRCTIYACLPV